MKLRHNVWYFVGEIDSFYNYDVILAVRTIRDILKEITRATIVQNIYH